MDISAILDLIVNTGLWAVLFVYLFYVDRHDASVREEYFKKREDEYTEFITQLTQILTDICDTLDSINIRLVKVEDILEVKKEKE